MMQSMPGLPGPLQKVANRWLLCWPPPDDEDFACLTGLTTEIAPEVVLAFYSEWLPQASGMPDATVELQTGQDSYTQGHVVHLDLTVAQAIKAPLNRLASVHAIMWHEAAHVRHPTERAWLDELYEREDAVGRNRVYPAYQMLEELRAQRELISVRPQAGPWLRYQLGSFQGMLPGAVAMGKRTDFGWAAAATTWAAPVVADVIDQHIFERVVRYDRRIKTEVDHLMPTWTAYSTLTDEQLNTGAGGVHIIELAHRLPVDI
jgi:hypothetical protein